MEIAKHLPMNLLEAGLETIRQAPKDEGVLEMIVRRPAEDQREVLEEGILNLKQGLVGDDWKSLGDSDMPDGSANPDKQLTIMNARVIDLLTGDRAFWPLAGDQLYINIDLSEDNLPAGSQLALGSALIEITTPPHTGCKKFAQRFGVDAVKFVNSSLGQQMHLRGVNARIVRPGVIRVGDVARRYNS